MFVLAVGRFPDPHKDPMFLTELNLLKETKQVHFTQLCVSKRTLTDLHSIVQLLERTVSPLYACKPFWFLVNLTSFQSCYRSGKSSLIRPSKHWKVVETVQKDGLVIFVGFQSNIAQVKWNIQVNIFRRREDRNSRQVESKSGYTPRGDLLSN